jgi:hypothetical protein
MRNDILGGITTFVAMAYIIVVNPAILKSAGLPVGASTVATIVVAAAGSLLMGLYANRPIAVAPYMGENAFLAFGLAALGMTWQQRLGSGLCQRGRVSHHHDRGTPRLAGEVDLAQPPLQLRRRHRTVSRVHRID